MQALVALETQGSWMSSLTGAQALKNARANTFSSWNRSKSSALLSDNPNDASTRIYDGYASVYPSFDGVKLNRHSKVFTMGSCFAREIEHYLKRLGADVISVTDQLHDPAFHDANGTPRTSYLHRFTPWSMWHELKAAFGEIDGWDLESSLLFDIGHDNYEDLNYWSLPGGDQSRTATIQRRQIIADLVRSVRQADVVVMTLGLTESWRHLPTGFHLNRISPSLVARKPDEFELHNCNVSEILDCLKDISELIRRVNENNAPLVLTVSPVPLQATFTTKDIVVANQDSKSALRAAACEFIEADASGCIYFPSYEMVNYSNPAVAWRPDRIHIDPGMVKHIVRTFVSSFYNEGALELNRVA